MGVQFPQAASEAVVYLKIGGERFATIFSIIDTCRKNSIDPIEALFQIFAGTFSFDLLNQFAEWPE